MQFPPRKRRFEFSGLWHQSEVNYSDSPVQGRKMLEVNCLLTVTDRHCLKYEFGAIAYKIIFVIISTNNAKYFRINADINCLYLRWHT